MSLSWTPNVIPQGSGSPGGGIRSRPTNTINTAEFVGLCEKIYITALSLFSEIPISGKRVEWKNEKINGGEKKIIEIFLIENMVGTGGLRSRYGTDIHSATFSVVWTLTRPSVFHPSAWSARPYDRINLILRVLIVVYVLFAQLDAIGARTDMTIIITHRVRVFVDRWTASIIINDINNNYYSNSITSVSNSNQC